MSRTESTTASSKQVGSPRILITRLSHIGDCVLTSPMVQAVREHFRCAWISWAVESPSHQIVETLPGIDEVIRIPKGWLKSPSKILEMRSELRKRDFDLTIDPQGLTKSAMLGWLSGAKRRIGFAKPWSGELAPWTYTEKVTASHTHIVLRSLDLLQPLGVKKPNIDFALNPKNDALIRVDKMIEQMHLGSGFIVINPNASWPSKVWSMDRFGQVAKKLGEQLGVTSLVVWAGDTEKQMAEEVSCNSGGHALVARPTTLQDLVALFYRARLCLSSDTGPLHIASAVGTPCVGLYGATLPEHCGAFGSHCINLQQAYQDGSRRERRKASNDAMMKIHVELVTNACRAKLGYDALPSVNAA